MFNDSPVYLSQWGDEFYIYKWADGNYHRSTIYPWSQCHFV